MFALMYFKWRRNFMFNISSFRNSLITKLFLSICLILIPLITILIVTNYYSVDVIKNKVAQSNEKMLNLHMNQMDQHLDNISHFVYQLSDDADISVFQGGPNTDYNDFSTAKLRLYNLILEQTNFYNPIDSLFVYSTHYNEMIYTQNFGDNYIERIDVSNEIQKLLDKEGENFNNGKWNVVEGEQQYYLLYTIKNENVFAGAWMNIEKLTTPFKHINFGELGKMIIFTSDFHPITDQQFLQSEGIKLEESLESYWIKGEDNQFIAMIEPSLKGDFSIAALIPKKVILEELPFIQRISLYITIGTVLFLVIFGVLMRNIFLKPIAQIVQAMKRLRKGDLNVRLPKVGNSTEFELMNKSFNHMISDIHHLKIDIYEKKLNLQRAELKHLQLQINPHFFLNSLNIIYNLATVKEFSLIQQMSQSLVNYFRFMFKSNSYFVSLEDEINHTINYLKIQQLRFPDTFTSQIEIDKKWSEIKIPPLVIQSLIENSIKHGLNFDDPLEINIRVWKQKPEDDYIIIQVEDTGDGFPEDVLVLLEKNESFMTEKGDRVGLWNIRRRLELLYGNSASVEFFNQPGAVIKIQLPLNTVDK